MIDDIYSPQSHNNYALFLISLFFFTLSQANIGPIFRTQPSEQSPISNPSKRRISLMYYFFLFSSLEDRKI